MPGKRRGPTLSSRFGSAYDNPNFALGQTDYFRNFRDLLDSWIMHEVGDGPILETGDPFLKKTGLGKVLTKEQLTQLVREENVPSPRLATVMGMHLPGEVLRRDEDSITELTSYRLRKRARKGGGPNALPPLELSDTAFRQFRKQFLDELLAARQPGNQPPEPDKQIQAIWDRLFTFFTTNAETPVSDETIRAKLASLYKKNPANIMALVGEVTGGEATGQEVQRFFSDFITRPLPPVAQALAFLRGSKGILQKTLAQSCHMSRNSLSEWEAGIHSIASKHLPELMRGLALTPEEAEQFLNLVRPAALSDAELHAQPEKNRAGSLLRNFRERRGMLQKTLAVLCTVAPSSAANWEIGATPIPLNRLPQIAQVLKLTPEETERLSKLVQLPQQPTELPDAVLHALPKDKQAGSLLAHLRKKRKLSQEHLGALVILSWERGINPIPLDQVLQLAHDMKLTTEETKQFSELVQPPRPLDAALLHAQPKDKQAGFLLCHLRKSRKLSQEKLGALCNVSHITISNWERGINHIPLDQIPQIVHALKLTTEETDRLSNLMQPPRPTELPDAVLHAQPKDKQAGFLLCHLRKNRKLSQEHLGVLCNVSYDTISNWERGIHRIPLNRLPQLAHALELTAKETGRLSDLVRPPRPTELPDAVLHAQPKDKQAGFLLCHLRKSRNLSQEKLGALCNVTSETILNWERGISRIPLKRLPQLAHALELTAEKTEQLSDLVRLTRGQTVTTEEMDHLLEPVRRAASSPAQINVQPPDKEAGLVLLHLRESRGISQVTLARSRALGVTAITIQQWENGDPIPPEKIPVLTRVLELDEAEAASLQPSSITLSSDGSLNEQTFHRAGVAYGATRTANPELLPAPSAATDTARDGSERFSSMAQVAALPSRLPTARRCASRG